jgi:hypothetical protein
MMEGVAGARLMDLRDENGANARRTALSAGQESLLKAAGSSPDGLAAVDRRQRRSNDARDGRRRAASRASFTRARAADAGRPVGLAGETGWNGG